MVCGNHTARVDAVVVFLALFLKGNRPAIIAKAELFRNPIARWFFTTRDLVLDRGKADLTAIKKALTVLKKGQKLIIFPEGTRVKEGMSSEAKSGAAMMAVRTGSPVLPVYITPGRKAFRGCTVTFGDPFYLPKPEKGEHDPYKKGADQIMEKIWEIGRDGGRQHLVGKITVAKNAGYCYGVRRAIEKAESLGGKDGRCIPPGR